MSGISPVYPSHGSDISRYLMSERADLHFNAEETSRAGASQKGAGRLANAGSVARRSWRAALHQFQAETRAVEAMLGADGVFR